MVLVFKIHNDLLILTVFLLFLNHYGLLVCFSIIFSDLKATETLA